MFSIFMKIWLLRSGIEWNPGPKKVQRDKCEICKKFLPVTGSCRFCEFSKATFDIVAGCSTSYNNNDSHVYSERTTVINNDADLAERMTLYSHISEKYMLNVASVDILISSGYSFGLFNQPITTKLSHHDPILQHFKVGDLQNVAADGACLFNVFSLALFGNETGSTRLRERICIEMKNIGFSKEQLFASGRQCSDVDEYLRMSGMQYRFAFGGDVEISTFCHIAQLTVLVFVASIGQWVEYCDITLQVTAEKGSQIFLYLEGCHFQLVTELQLLDEFFQPLSQCATTLSVQERPNTKPSEFETPMDDSATEQCIEAVG